MDLHSTKQPCGLQSLQAFRGPIGVGLCLGLRVGGSVGSIGTFNRYHSIALKNYQENVS